MSEEKSKTENQSRTGGLQREAEALRAEGKRLLRQNIKAIREGHATGGYCITEALHEEERHLHKILSKELEEAKAKHGYSPDPKFKPKEVRDIELELNGLSWKPVLVEAAA